MAGGEELTEAPLPLPALALSVRQPWAWALIYGGKDFENRSNAALHHMKADVGRIAIHASIGMTQKEYQWAADYMANLGVICPLPADLVRGAIIGSVRLGAKVKHGNPVVITPWRIGVSGGYVSVDPWPCLPLPAVGALGFFRWKPSTEPIAAALPWMVKFGVRKLAAGPIAAPAFVQSDDTPALLAKMMGEDDK